MRLFKEEKEFLNKEVENKYTLELKAIRDANSKAMEDVAKETTTVKNFIQVAKSIIPNPKTDVNVYETYVKVELKNEKIELEAKFELDGRLEWHSSWYYSANSDNFADVFLDVPLRTKAPKNDDERFDVISKMVDEIGQRILDKERNRLQQNLEIIKKL